MAHLIDLSSLSWLWSTAIDDGPIASRTVLLVSTKDLFIRSMADIESLQIKIQAALIFVRLNTLSFRISFTLCHLDYDIEKYLHHCKFSMPQSLLHCACCLVFKFVLDFQQEKYRDIVFSVNVLKLVSGMALCEYAAQVG